MHQSSQTNEFDKDQQQSIADELAIFVANKQTLTGASFWLANGSKMPFNTLLSEKRQKMSDELLESLLILNNTC